MISPSASTWVTVAWAACFFFTNMVANMQNTIVLVSASEAELHCLLRSGWWRGDHINNNTSHCYWPGITCNHAGSVVEISLNNGTYYEEEGNKEFETLKLSCFPDLIRLNGSNAILTGSIPTEIGTLSKLTHLDLSNNDLTGEFPLSLAKLPKLAVLDLQNNKLYGSIPQELGSLKNLIALNLSLNFFSGPIPSTLGLYLENLVSLQLSNNLLSGLIPSTLGQLTKLVFLDLSSNQINGSIPLEFRNLKNLTHLNLSNNCLYGIKPSQFGNLTKLTSRDLSSNSVPVDHETLCHIRKGFLSRCSRFRIIVAVVALGPTLILLVILFTRVVVNKLVIWLQNKKFQPDKGATKNGDIFSIWNFDGHIAFEEIIKATKDFDIRYRIGTGSYGSVYRARLPNNELVAVKKLHSSEVEEPALRKSFMNEVKALTKIRHRNIVKLRGFCLHNRFMFLIYEYMKGGSLFSVLSNDVGAVELDWSKRVNVIKGVAHALSYMHHDCTPPIVHRDITTTNILMNSVLDAFVADFGTAKLLNPNSSNQTMLAGTYGYIAPGKYFHPPVNHYLIQKNKVLTWK